MGLYWTKLIVAATVGELIDEGFLSPFEVYAPPREVDLSKVKITAGDYNEKQLGKTMNQPELVADIVKTWLERGENEQTFLFAVDRAHAANLQNEFRKAGVPCGYIDGHSDDDERRETFRRYRNGDDRIIASVGCLITGVDEDVRCIIVARPTKSIILNDQMIGRGLRTAAGKKRLLILDHAGNSLREGVGLVTDPRPTKLSTAKPGEREPPEAEEKKPPKNHKCPSCGRVMPPQARVCPSCGEVSIPKSDVKAAEGELVKLNVSRKARNAERAERQAFYSGLLWIAKKNGKAEGSAAYTFREKFGCWPDGLLKEAKVPSQEVRAYETSRRIAFAKSRKQG
ncbi:MAG: helicase-related protein [Methylocella sp.]